MSIFDWCRKSIFTLDYDEVALEGPGIEVDPTLKPRLEEVPTRFLDGYHIAVECGDDQARLAERLDAEIDPAFTGFAYEGAGMYLALVDFVTPTSRNRVNEFLGAHGASHDYIICIGVCFAVARIPWARRAASETVKRYPPGLAGLVMDGYGFHDGFFHADRVIDRREVPSGVVDYPARCFDNGIGRALWFVKGADPTRIANSIRAFDESRHADLWAGVGLACAYAGSAYPDADEYVAVLDRIIKASGEHIDHLRLGVVFAAETRRKGNNPTDFTARACERIVGRPFAEVAAIGIDTWNAVSAEMDALPPRQISFDKHRELTDRVLSSVRSSERTSAA